MLHSLIVVPFYFFGALTSLALLMVLGRILRLRLPIYTLVYAAVGASLLATIGLLSSGVLSIKQLTVLPMLGLAAASAILVAIDVALSRILPADFDAELRDL